MGIIIKKDDGINWLYSVSHTPFNFTPFTNPSALQDFSSFFKIGKIKKLYGLELDKEYPDLNCYKDFEIVDRILQVKHENGLIYDDLTYELKCIKRSRINKINKINKT